MCIKSSELVSFNLQLSSYVWNFLLQNTSSNTFLQTTFLLRKQNLFIHKTQLQNLRSKSQRPKDKVKLSKKHKTLFKGQFFKEESIRGKNCPTNQLSTLGIVIVDLSLFCSGNCIYAYVYGTV